MSGPSDKARYYLENTISDLNELERKKIFTRAEISSISKKRSDFEHIINARGSHPSDYLRYIEFEKNVDALRRKRIKRMGVRSTGSGQRSIFFLFSRGVKKFPGDLELWIQYIDFARKDKAYKKLNEILTSVVRLHPAKPELWIYAAEYFMDTQADMTNARSYMQRGMRFCKNSRKMYLEYAKLETLYIAKIAGRRKILGLDIDRSKKVVEEGPDADMITLPTITAEDINPSLGKDDGVDEVALQNLASTPVLTGAIPIAIYDSAMKQFQADSNLAEQFFDMFAEFDQLSCISRILQHVVDHLKQGSPHSVHAISCDFKLQLQDASPTSPNFISILRSALDLLHSALEQHPGMKSSLAETAIRKLLPLLEATDSVDEPALKKALTASVRKYSGLLEENNSGEKGDALAQLVETLQEERKRGDAARLIQTSTKQWGSNAKLSQMAQSLDT